MKKVLYCGMADDIIRPILLVPDFDVLYAIDYFDRAFAKGVEGTLEGQMDDIREMIKVGHDENSRHREVRLSYPPHQVDILRLKNKSDIIDESHDCENNVWKLHFLYEGKERQLIYFQYRNFIEDWPEEITEINHLMCMGATFPIFKEEDCGQEPNLVRMVKERTCEDFKYYSGNHSMPDIPEKTVFEYNNRSPVGMIEGTYLLNLLKMLDKRRDTELST